MTGVLIRKGYLDIQKDARDTCKPGQDYVRTQGRSGRMQARERDPRGNQNFPHLDLGLLTSKSVRK